MTWLNEYKRSLKNLHAEEPLDVYFYRPLAFVIVKSFYSFPITPNQYSLMALLSGVASGVYFYKGTPAGMQWGGFYFLLFAILDCCDGMVARLKKNGTEFGRLVDGGVDYIVNIIVYVTLAMGMNKGLVDQGFISPWSLVILAGISKAIHAMTYDHYLSEYLSYERGDGAFIGKEIETLKVKITENAQSNGSKFRQLVLKIYLGYSILQAGNLERKLIYSPQLYCQKNLLALRLWSLLGPSVHIAFLIIAFLLGQPKILFYYAILFGNMWLLSMFLYQFKINRNLEKKESIN